MKTVVLLSVLACALGLPQMPRPSSGGANNRQGMFNSGFGAGTQGFGAGAQGFGAGAQGPGERNWGPKAYGPGLNNPWAFPVNPFVMTRAVSLTESCPGTLVKVEVTGEVTITDQHGFEVEIVDWQGNDVTEGITEFEQPETQFVIGGPPGFGGPGFGGFPGSSGFGGPQGFGGSPSFNSAAGAGGQSGFGRPPCFRRPTSLFG